MKDYSKLPQVAPEYDLTDLLEAGCHFGHQKSKWNPKMAEFIYMEKDGVHIFDLAKTASQLQIAYNFVFDMASKGKTMVVVGTKKQAKQIIEAEAKENEVMYITSRWLGGLLTNWNQVKKSLRKMLNIANDLKSGKYDAYTKFEKVQLEKEQIKLERFFGGIKDLKTTPDFLFIVDVQREKNAIKEAKLMGVPVVALIDSNANPEDVDIAIPANDDALRSIQLIIKEIIKAYTEGRKSTSKTTVKTNSANATISNAVVKTKTEVDVKTSAKAKLGSEIGAKTEVDVKTKVEKVEGKSTEVKKVVKTKIKPTAKVVKKVAKKQVKSK